MIIIAIKTDNPEAELYLYDSQKEIINIKWQAHRQLADTIHFKIKEALDSQYLELSDIEGVVIFRGPGSFTGLRIGASVVNTLAYAVQVPIVGTTGADWLIDGLKRLLVGQDDKIVVPYYGAEANITLPKK